MDTAFEKPGAIQQRDAFEGPRFYWPLPARNERRYFVITFFALGTIGWASGLIAGIWHLIVDRDLFTIGWIAGWAVCGGLFPPGLVAALRLRPESVLLGNGHLVYDHGWNLVSDLCLAGILTGVQPLFSKPITLPKAEIAGFALENAGPRHQLVFDHAGKRIEIGAVLRERDRERLFNILEAWRVK